MDLSESELILNPDGSIYHLKLSPEDIATTIITVGDPQRVNMVTKYFDSIELKREKREFITHTGMYKGKRLTVISTGIGTDNIDIVFNELDALANIDFKTRKIKPNKTQLDFIRIGTSGSIQHDLPVDSFLLSTSAIGFDGLLHFYSSEEARNKSLENDLNKFLAWEDENIVPYAVDGAKELIDILSSNRIRYGITSTNSGFYGPQGRFLRLKPKIADLNDRLKDFQYGKQKITNLEMETSAMYGLAKMLGHRAISMNVILANRVNGEFSENGYASVDALIKYTLEKLVQ
nr:nucleoside phosphorylase [Allomuricauda sp.]